MITKPDFIEVDGKYVYRFAEGDRDQRNLLGGKGANLAEMTKLGLPVPPGFTITTQACRAYLSTGWPDGLTEQVRTGLAELETELGKRLGDAENPLLVSVRSGAPYSMPGMMETVLNVGLTDESVRGLAHRSGDERFAYDSYRRLVQMFGKTVLGIDGDPFEDAIAELKSTRGRDSDVDLTADDLRDLVTEFHRIVRDKSGREFPQDPLEQLRLAIRAVFDSWNAPRAVLYRRQERIPDDIGTAVSVVAMVFGNTGPESGTGVAFTRDPSSGASGIYGDYLTNAQGEDVVAGIRNTVPLADLETIDPKSYGELLTIMSTLERHYRDMCDIEFTIEHGKLWMLQTRIGKRTAAAAFRIAIGFVDADLIDLDEAVRRVSGQELARLMFPRFGDVSTTAILTTGTGASPGAAVGAVVFSSDEAVRQAEAGTKVILLRRETNPDDLHGMIAAEGVLTSRGGKTSHAAVVARGMGKTCVCGAEDLDIDIDAGRATTTDGTVIAAGDTISIDGTTGVVYSGAVGVVDSPVVEYFEGQLDPDSTDDALVRSVHRVMTHADDVRRLDVRANADTATDAARARRFGAAGIGLCRTEHMFLGERRPLVQRLILADSDDEREAALADLLPMQRDDFVELFEAMDDLPVTVRLIDPPLHEFLPDLTELSVRVAVANERGSADPADVDLLRAVKRLHEQNPMIGLRGVRLGVVVPGLFRMQVRAIAQAAAHRLTAGGRPRPEVMIPLVSTVRELELVRREAETVLAEVAAETGQDVSALIGTMVELPRAALTAGDIAGAAEFFSFGTNDLTQMVWGFSRDDVESGFFPAYFDQGIFQVSPFETIDVEGVGALIRTAVEQGRERRPDLKLGICGEHGGDPDSVWFFHQVGLDYVSCSPFRIPIARLEAARATLND